jgi:DNA repair protein RadC
LEPILDTEIRGTDTNPSLGQLASDQPAPDWEKIAVLAKALGVRSSSGLAALARHLEGCGWSLRDAVRAILHSNVKLSGIGPVSLARLCAGIELLNMLAEEGARTGPLLAGSDQTKRYLHQYFALADREYFVCLLLDSRHRLLRSERLFAGTIDGAAVYPRVVVALALRLGAAAAIVAHNHPSGCPEPSSADRLITKRLHAALALVDIRLLDHVIVGRGRCVSMAETGDIPVI